MNIGHRAEAIGDGLLISRIKATTSLEEPLFDHMGALVGPSLVPDKWSIAVTAKQRGLTFILDRSYRPSTPGLTGMRLENGHLIAHQGIYRGESCSPVIPKYHSAWPLEGAFEIPIQHPHDSIVGDLVELEFDSLQPFFNEERRRYEADRTVREQGVVAYGGLLLQRESQFDPQSRNRFAEYRDGAVIVALTELGQLAVSTVGQRGTLHYLLKDSGKRYSRGYRNFHVREGKIYGKNGNKPSRFALARLASRHISKVPIAILG